MTETNSNSSRGYRFVFARWLLVAATVFILTLLSGVYITNNVLPKVYTASVLVQIVPQVTTEIGSSFSVVDNSPEAFVQSCVAKMQQPDVLLPVINELNLKELWSKQVFKSQSLSDSDALSYLQKMLRLEVKRGTNIIVVTAACDIPREAADVANAIAHRYKNMRDTEKNASFESGNVSLRNQIAQQQKVVDEKKAAVEKMRKDLSVDGDPTFPGWIEHADKSLDTRKKDLLNAKEDYDGRRVLLEQLQKLSDDEFLNTLAALNRSEPNIAALQTDIPKLESEIDTLLKSGTKEDDAQIVALRQNIETKKNQIKELVAGMRRAMELDTEVAKSRVALFQKQVDALTAETAENLSGQLEPLRDAQRDLAQQDSVLEAFKLRLKQLEADQQLIQSPVVIISRAETPTVPSQPNKVLSYAVTVVAGLFLSVIIASLVEIVLWKSRARK